MDRVVLQGNTNIAKMHYADDYQHHCEATTKQQSQDKMFQIEGREHCNRKQSAKNEKYFVQEGELFSVGVVHLMIQINSISERTFVFISLLFQQLEHLLNQK